MKINGECHCGAIAFEAELEPENVGICHCTDCQALSASAFRTIAVVPGNAFRITRGTPKQYVKVGDSGNRRVQGFCGNCGSGLYSADVGDNPRAYSIRVGTVAQRHQLVPRFELWRKSSLPWLPESDVTQKFEKNPE